MTVFHINHKSSITTEIKFILITETIIRPTIPVQLQLELKLKLPAFHS